jgi:hypothetical protein
LNSEKEFGMAANVDDILPKASDVMMRIAEAQAEKAAAHDRQKAAEQAEKDSMIKMLSQPSGLSEEEKVKRAATVIKRAMDNGLLEVQVYRFPNAICTDHGRAINQAEPGWEQTLTGIPKEIYHLWHDHLREKGYKIRCQILEFPGGLPGDIGITLSWH